MRVLRLILVAPALAALAAGPARAQNRAPDRITIVVGYSAGGGYDHYARTLARHVGRHLPGQPSVIVQNMPGAATLTAVRWLDVTAPKDGSAVAMFDPALIIRSVNAEPVRAALARVRWLGAMLRDIRICYAGRRPASARSTT
jgi:tripartite-type tricarboxylate transporter receptor subunit TctC